MEENDKKTRIWEYPDGILKKSYSETGFPSTF